MIDIRKLKELVRLMVENDLSELDLKDKEETVLVRRGSGSATIVNHQPVIYNGVPGPAAAAPAAPRVAPAAPEQAGGASDAPVAATHDTAGLAAIQSPMVGSFYSAPSPDAAPFVSVGTSVGPDTVVCLIEAMKVFNEIKAECSGTVERVLVNSGDAVEFGQKLFLVRPS